jgi:transposase
MTGRKKQLEQATRETIIRKYNAGKNPKTIGNELELNRKTISSVILKYKSTGRILAVKKRAPKNKKINEAGRDLIRAAITDDVSVTLKELKGKLFENLGINASITTISNCLEEMNYSFKRVVLVPEARNTTELINLTFSYCSNYLLIDENTLIFVDEFGISCSTRIGYGRSIIGTNPKKEVRAIRSKNFSICAAVCKIGLISFEINEVHIILNRLKNF